MSGAVRIAIDLGVAKSLFLAGALLCVCWRYWEAVWLQNCLAGLRDVFALMRLPASLFEEI